MEFRDVLAVLAIVISVATFVANFAFNASKARFDRRPVLSFADNGEVWELRNIGNGPAMDIVIQQQHVRGGGRGEWFDPVRVPDLGKDKGFALDWLGRVNDTGLGATYRDAAGHQYLSRAGDDRNVSSGVSRWRRPPPELAGLRAPAGGQRVPAHWQRSSGR